jgi:hypothetical protein
MNDLYKAIDALKKIVNEEVAQELEERVTYSTLAKLSGIKDPNKIFPGQKITLPGGGSYTVKSGDTLSGIAQNYRLKKIGQPKSGKLDVPTTKLPQISPIAGAGDRKSGPTRQDIRVDRSNKALARDFKKVKDAGGGILDKIGAGDDTDDRLNKYAFSQRGDYKLDPSSVKQPPKPADRPIPEPKQPTKPEVDTKPADRPIPEPKQPTKPEVDPTSPEPGQELKASGKSLYNQFTDWAKGTKWYDMAKSNPEPKITNAKGDK